MSLIRATILSSMLLASTAFSETLEFSYAGGATTCQNRSCRGVAESYQRGSVKVTESDPVAIHKYEFNYSNQEFLATMEVTREPEGVYRVELELAPKGKPSLARSTFLTVTNWDEMSLVSFAGATVENQGSRTTPNFSFGPADYSKNQE